MANVANFDQAQSPRLGQPLPPSNTTVLFYTGDDLPEVAWHGHMIYREDLQVLQVYDATVGAWEDVTTGEFGILTFVGPEPPTAVNAGDLWFDTDDNRKMYRAEEVGANTITEAGGGGWVLSGFTPGVQIFKQPDEPTGAEAGDLWFDDDAPPGEPTWFLYDGTVWVAVTDGLAAYAAGAVDEAIDTANDALTAAEAAQTTADGKIETFFQSSMPTEGSIGDLWFDTDDKQAYRHNGTTFVSVQDTAIQNALTTANEAASAVDGKITSFYQTTTPTGAEVGDLWYNTSTSPPKVKYYNGSTWGDVPIYGDGLVDSGWAGKTFTGATFRTAASGQRIEMRSDVAGGVIYSYGGILGETPTHIDPTFISGAPALEIRGGNTPARPGSPTVQLATTTAGTLGTGGQFAVTAREIWLFADSSMSIQGAGSLGISISGGVQITQSLDILNGLDVGGNATIDGTLTVGGTPVIGAYSARAQATSDLTLTGSLQDIPGCSISVPVTSTSHVYEIIGVFDFSMTTSGDRVAIGAVDIGQAMLNGSNAIFSGVAAGLRATVTQTWRVTYNSTGNRTTKLRAQYSGSTGAYAAKEAHCSIFIKRVS